MARNVSYSVCMISDELHDSRLVTRFRDLEIYQIHGTDAPQTMAEIGRIREHEFSSDGGGTGKDIDIDEYDTMSYCYQLLVWDPKYQQILSAYRYIPMWRIPADHRKNGSPSSRLFDLSNRFYDDIAPGCIELGRSVVNRKAKRSILGLFAVWSGLGALIAELPRLRWFFGKLTLYPEVPKHLRHRIFAFWDRFFPGDETLMAPVVDYSIAKVENDWSGYPDIGDRDTAFKRLSAEMSDAGWPVPPLMKSYIAVSSEIQSFGTALNSHFGNVYETAILLPIETIGGKTREQFIDSYTSINPGLFSY